MVTINAGEFFEIYFDKLIFRKNPLGVLSSNYISFFFQEDFVIYTVVTSKFGFFQKNLVKKKIEKGVVDKRKPTNEKYLFSKKKVFDFQKKVLFSKKSFLFFHYL